MDRQAQLEEFFFRMAHISQLTLEEKVILAGEATEHPTYKMEDLFRKVFFSSSKRRAILNEWASQDLNKLYTDYKQRGIRWLTLLDVRYPDDLRQIHAPPILLFYKGEVGLLQRKKLSIVGSRKSTWYGRAVLRRLLPTCVPDYVIVSGLARGVDTYAHKETLRLGGSTIAVLASGLNQVYPSENSALQTEIGTHHLLLSEHPVHRRPLKHHFPMRNRLLAGLSDAVIVIEAEARSGSVMTAHSALDEGREVFCVPGNITSPLSAGANHLIQEGAHCLYDVSLLKEMLPRS